MKLPFRKTEVKSLEVISSGFTALEQGGASVNLQVRVLFDNNTYTEKRAVACLTQEQVEHVAEIVGLPITVEVPVPAAVEQPKRHRKVCRNGHAKPYLGECQVCLFLYNQRKDKAKKSKNDQVRYLKESGSKPEIVLSRPKKAR